MRALQVDNRRSRKQIAQFLDFDIEQAVSTGAKQGDSIREFCAIFGCRNGIEAAGCFRVGLPDIHFHPLPNSSAPNC
jgi:hypothetical protein